MLDSRCHPRIIGARGKNVRKLMEDFGVEIRFPRSEGADPDLVTVCGIDLLIGIEYLSGEN